MTQAAVIYGSAVVGCQRMAWVEDCHGTYSTLHNKMSRIRSESKDATHLVYQGYCSRPSLQWNQCWFETSQPPSCLMFDSVRPPTPITRHPTNVHPLTHLTPSFTVKSGDRSFKHQYANIYFVRLRLLRELIEKEAVKKWAHFPGKLRLHAELSNR